MTTPNNFEPSEIDLRRRKETPWIQAMRSFVRQRSAILGMIIIGGIVLVAIFANQIAPYRPEQVLIGQEDVKKRAAALHPPAGLSPKTSHST